MEATNKTYFEWLYSLVEEANPGGKPFRRLMADLHHAEFISSVPNDDNRAKDGEDLRVQFIDHYESAAQPLVGRPCTVFEMFIALAYRMKEILVGEPFEMSVGECFWMYVRGLDLEWYDDNNDYHLYGEGIEMTIKRFVERRYNYSGHGGIFPLKRAKRDQRKTEIWYQMSDYLLENHKF